MSILVVIFGARRFAGSDLTGHEAFARAANGFAQYAQEKLGAEVVSFFDSEKACTDQLDRFDELIAAEKHETLIVFYVGHGLYLRLGGRDEYALAVSSTAREKPWTALRAGDLAEAIKAHAKPQQRLIILDACFASAAVASFQSGDQVPQQKVRSAFQAVPGTAVLAASSKDEAAHVAEDRELTNFSRALLKVLATGDPRSPATHLSIREVSNLIEAEVLAAGGTHPQLHVPEQHKGRVDVQPLFPNPSPAPEPHVPPAATPEREARPTRQQRIRVALVRTVITGVVAGILGYLGEYTGIMALPDEEKAPHPPPRRPPAAFDAAPPRDGATGPDDGVQDLDGGVKDLPHKRTSPRTPPRHRRSSISRRAEDEAAARAPLFFPDLRASALGYQAPPKPPIPDTELEQVRARVLARARRCQGEGFDAEDLRDFKVVVFLDADGVPGLKNAIPAGSSPLKDCLISAARSGMFRSEYGSRHIDYTFVVDGADLRVAVGQQH